MPITSGFTYSAVLVTAALLAAACGPTQVAAPAPTPRPTTQSPAEARPAQALLTPAPGVAGNAATGRQLLVSKGCAGCHTVAGVPGATGVMGPNLTNITLRPTLTGAGIPNTPENMTRWILNPPALKPGTAMPSLGLTQQEAQDLTAFLYSQPYNPPR